MNFLQSVTSAVISASTAALNSAAGGIPGLAGYTVGEKVLSFEGKTIWTLHDGIKKDDSTPVSIFVFETTTQYSSSYDRKQLYPLARNALKKLRSLRHPNILKFIDGVESDSGVWIVTERIKSLVSALPTPESMSDENKVYGLLHLATALSFLNKDGQSIHGNIRPEAIFLTQGGDWRLGGMEVCSRKEEDSNTLFLYGGILPDSRTYSSPEVRKSGWKELKRYDASTLDSYQLHLLIFNLFNGALPVAFSASSDMPPTLPNMRGNIPPNLFQAWRRLGAQNPAQRLRTDVLLDVGSGPEASGGWWPSNRLVKISNLLESFALASEGEKATSLRTLKDLEGQNGADALPSDFLTYKVLPSLVRAFEFGGGGPAVLPLILAMAAGLPSDEYVGTIIQPLLRMFASPDRAMRMALLEGLDKFIDKLTVKDINEKVWPHLATGFGDIVPVIREATVKSILLIAPKLTERILNNDLLRHLAKTQTDVVPGIRTNTCILLGRLSKHLQASTNRKVLVPAFARAVRDPFVHARIAGLMALMATLECYEREDIAGKVIPSMSICLVDKEGAVRLQAFKAIDLFVKRCNELVADMPETVMSLEAAQNGAGVPGMSQQNINQPGLATNAAGAAGALASWAFASVSKKLTPADLAAPIDGRPLSVPPPGQQPPNGLPRPMQPNASPAMGLSRSASNGATPRSSISSGPNIPGGFGMDEEDNADWGGDLIDVQEEEAEWDDFKGGRQNRTLDPLASRLSTTTASKPQQRGGALKLGAASRSAALRIPMDMDAGDSWDIDSSAASPWESSLKPSAAPKPKPASPALAQASRAPVLAPPIAPTPRAPVLSPPLNPSAPKPKTTATGSLNMAIPPLVPRQSGSGLSMNAQLASPPPMNVAAARPVVAPVAAAPAPSPAGLGSYAPMVPKAKPAPGFASPPQSPPVFSPPPVASSIWDTPPLGATPGSPVGGQAAQSMSGMSKDEKAARIAAAKEERRLRMAQARGGR